MRVLRRLVSPLAVALLLGIAAMLAAYAQLLRGASAQYSDGVMQLLRDQFLRSSVTIQRTIIFLLIVNALYLLLGFSAWLLWRLSRSQWRVAQAKPRLGVTVWFLALWSLVELANASLYPWSQSGGTARLINAALPQFIAPWQILFVGMAMLSGWLIWRGAVQAGRQRLLSRCVVWGLVAAAALAVIQRMPRDAQPSATAGVRSPNLVLIGLDSLRPDLVGNASSAGFTPSISRFLAEGRRYEDATTPLARTFPSWITLLTGRLPVSTGARENLIPRERLKLTGSLPERLRAAGYLSVYATDEVRFSNIDGGYGFDKTLTPRIGSSDFLLGTLNDLPLTNLLSNTVVARWLFPDTYANRAAAVTYDPASFVDRLRAQVPASGRQPVFLAMHLTLPHWPYYWRAEASSVLSNTDDSRYAYLASALAVDRQFADVLRVLEGKGFMENTVFVVFSDHGEALGLQSDNLILSRDAKNAAGRIPVWMSGHGTSVLSFPQYHVLLAMRCFTVKVACPQPGRDMTPASMEDIAPTLRDLLRLDSSGTFDGISLLRSGTTDGVVLDRIRVTESALATPTLREGNATAGNLLAEAGSVFQVNAESGRVELNPAGWRELLNARERAAIGPTRILAAIPAEAAGQSKFLVVQRDGRGLPRRLLAAPGDAEDPEIQRLWQALHAAYPGELGEPADDQGGGDRFRP